MALAASCTSAGATCSFYVARNVHTAMQLHGTGNRYVLKLNTFPPKTIFCQVGFPPEQFFSVFHHPIIQVLVTAKGSVWCRVRAAAVPFSTG